MEKKSNNKKQDFIPENITPYVASLVKYMMEHCDIDLKPFPKIILSKDKEYINDIFGRTAWYEPENNSITLITEGRHPKDILRSLAHELIHHNQRLKGKMDEIDDLDDPQYTQNSKALRKLEEDAYLRGNMCFRDWEDTMKNKK